MKLRELENIINQVQREPVQPAEVESLKSLITVINTKISWRTKASVLTAEARMKFRVAVDENRDLLGFGKKRVVFRANFGWRETERNTDFFRSRKILFEKKILDQNLRGFLKGVDGVLRNEIEKYSQGKLKVEVRGTEIFLEKMRASFRRRIEVLMVPDLFDEIKKRNEFCGDALSLAKEKLKKDTESIPPEILEIQERLKKLGYTF